MEAPVMRRRDVSGSNRGCAVGWIVFVIAVFVVAYAGIELLAHL